MADIHFVAVASDEAGPANPDATQHAMIFAADGSAVQALDTPEGVRKRYRDASRLRTDARRTAEYLASRGLTPIENLHDVARMPPAEAVPFIQGVAGCSAWQALQFWRDCCTALLPYTAPRFDAIDLSALAGAAAAGGSLAAAHFLAAQQASEQLARDRSALADAGGPGTVQGQLAGADEAGPDDGPTVLPPIGPD